MPSAYAERNRAIDKNKLFYAHAVYQPQLTRRKATSGINGQSSLAVVTNGFIEPKSGNFGSIIVKNGSTTSDRNKQMIKTTQSWLKADSVIKDEESLVVEESPSSAEHNV